MNKKEYRLYKIILLGLLVLVVSFKDFNNPNEHNKMTMEQLKEVEKEIIIDVVNGE